MTAVVFSPTFQAANAYRVEVSYNTDITTATDGTEGRRRLRTIPMRRETYTVGALDSRAAGILEYLLATGPDQQWAVPYWPHASRLTAAAAAGSGVVLACDTSDRDFTATGQGILWRDAATYELVTFTAMTGSSLTVATLASDWAAGTLVVPARTGRIDPTQTLRRWTTRGTEADVTFDLDAQIDPGTAAASLATFTVAGLNRDDVPAHGFARLVNRIHPPTSNFADYPVVDDGTTTVPLTMAFTSRAQVNDLLTWFYSVRGRFLAQWVPLYWQPFDVSDALSTAPTLTIASCGYATCAFPREARRHIALVTPAGAVTRRRVTAAVDNGDGTETLTLSSAFGVAISGTTSMLCPLIYARLAEDTLAIEWESPEFARATVTFVEIPAEAPTSV